MTKVSSNLSLHHLLKCSWETVASLQVLELILVFLWSWKEDEGTIVHISSKLLNLTLCMHLLDHLWVLKFLSWLCLLVRSRSFGIFWSIFELWMDEIDKVCKFMAYLSPLVLISSRSRVWYDFCNHGWALGLFSHTFWSRLEKDMHIKFIYLLPLWSHRSLLESMS